MEGQRTAKRCVTCDRRHTYDGTRGWRAADGHPFRAKASTDTVEEYRRAAAEQAAANPMDNVRRHFKTTFGMFDHCTRCGTHVEPLDHFRAIHMQHVCPFRGDPDAA